MGSRKNTGLVAGNAGGCYENTALEFSSLAESVESANGIVYEIEGRRERVANETRENRTR